MDILISMLRRCCRLGRPAKEMTAERKRSDGTTPVLTDTLALYTSTMYIPYTM